MKQTIQFWQQSHGIYVPVNLSDETYNGHTIEDLLEKTNHLGIYQKEYLENAKTVIECQTTGCNLNLIHPLKNRNFDIANDYLSGTLFNKKL